MNIKLHIERLVLEGLELAPNQRSLLEASLTSELTRLLNEGGLASGLREGAALARLSTNSIQLNGNHSVQMGQAIARSLYGGIGHE